MKRMLMLALALVMLTACALAEDSHPFGSFNLTVPEDAAVEENDLTLTVIREQARVVVQVIPQELSEDGQAQVRELLSVYNENIAEVTDVPLVAGLYGAMGLIEDRLDEGIHEIPVLILARGELLILSGYDLEGDTLAVHTLIADLLSGVTFAGEPILPALDSQPESSSRRYPLWRSYSCNPFPRR